MPTLDEARGFLNGLTANPGRGPAPGSDAQARGVLAGVDDPEAFIDAVAAEMVEQNTPLINGQVIALMIQLALTFVGPPNTDGAESPGDDEGSGTGNSGGHGQGRGRP